MIVMPAMGAAQQAAWYGLLDLHKHHPDGWTLIGGQLVHLHCAERNYSPQRPTDDADAVVNARSPLILGAVTESLRALDYDPGEPSADGIQHRWTNGEAIIDVLVPDGLGERAAYRPSASGFRTVAAPGGTQALHRSEVVTVQVADRTGTIPRPSLVGALILKAKARISTTGPALDRHTHDFATLANMLAAADLRNDTLTKSERKALRTMIGLTFDLPEALDPHSGVAERLARLEAAVGDHR